MNDNKNTILAILLSVIVLVACQYFVGIPQMEKQREQAQRTQQQTPAQPAPAPGQPAATPGSAPAPGQPPRPGTAAQPTPGAPATVPATTSREAALAASPRITVETPRMRGSISLRGARIDDVSLTQYRDRRSEESEHRAVVALGRPASVLCRVRLGRRARRDFEAARPRHALDRCQPRPARARPAG